MFMTSICVNTLISPLEYVYSSMRYPCFSDLVDEIVLRLSIPVFLPSLYFLVGGFHNCLDDQNIIRVYYYTSRNDTHLSHTEAWEIEAIPHCFPSPCNAIMALFFSPSLPLLLGPELPPYSIYLLHNKQ